MTFQPLTIKQTISHIDNQAKTLIFDVPAENCMAVEQGLLGVNSMVEYPPEFEG